MPSGAYRMSRTTGIPVLIWIVFVLSLVPGHADPTEGEAKGQCPCPSPEVSVPEPSPDSEECPETLVLKQLVEVYEEVSFSHAEHAEMVDEGCTSCHHKAPPGVYQKCGACHEKGLFEAEKLNMINLKAAYHRQCIECHVAYESGPTGCTECHEIRE
jgi:hypothetical protein